MAVDLQGQMTGSGPLVRRRLEAFIQETAERLARAAAGGSATSA